jgi:RNA polymerase sigma-70 factor, ECF subfamily
MTPASEQLWETFSAPLHQFIRRRMSDPHNAEDILQDVFLKIHTRIDTLHQQDRIAAWIYQIARNAITYYYRAAAADDRSARNFGATWRHNGR